MGSKISKQKGFTLVELLIVIVVIGVLSAMMMLSSTEAVSSAKANNILSNLRNFKTATLAWYTDNLDKVDGNGHILVNGQPTGEFAESAKKGGKELDIKKITAQDILPYLNNGGGVTLQDGKVLDSSGGQYYTDWIGPSGSSNGDKTARQWVITYQMPTNDTRIRQKLEAKATTAKLRFKVPGGSNKGEYKASYVDSNKYYVSMIVLDFNVN